MSKPWMFIEFSECYTSFDSVNAIRRWVAREVKEGEPCLDRDFPEINYAQLSLDSLAGLLINTNMAARCGPTNVLLRKLIEYYGYGAYNIDMGYANTHSTHISCIAQIVYKGQRIEVVEDAFFNITYRNKKGEPLPFNQLVDWVKQGCTQECIVWQKNDTTRLQFVQLLDNTSVDSAMALKCWGYIPQKELVNKQKNLYAIRYVRKRPPSNILCDEWWAKYCKELKDHGLKQSFESSYLLIFNRF